MKKILFFTAVFPTAPLLAFSSCSNPTPIKTPDITISDSNKISFVYPDKIFQDYSFNLDNFEGGEIIYLQIINQKIDGISGEYVNFAATDDPFTKTETIYVGQKVLNEKIILMNPISNIDSSKISFDINMIVLNNGRTLSNITISNFVLYITHPTPESAFLTERDAEGNINLVGLDLENHLEEIENSDLLLIPKNVNHINNNAFYKNQASTIPDNIKWLDFETNIKDFPILTRIGDNAFKMAPFINKIEFPSTLQYIGTSAFEKCRNISGTLVLPKWLDTLGSYAFDGCTSITGIQFMDNKLKSLPDSVFNDCDELQSINFFPSSIQYIGTRAFSNCEKLQPDLLIPPSVSRINDYAFYNCKKVSSLSFLNKDVSGLIYIGNNAFEGSGLSNISLPDSIETIDDKAFYQCKLNSPFVLPKNLKTIGDHAFDGCDLTWTLTFNDKLENLGVGAFDNNKITIIDICDAPIIEPTIKLPIWAINSKGDSFSNNYDGGSVFAMKIAQVDSIMLFQIYPSLSNWNLIEIV